MSNRIGVAIHHQEGCLATGDYQMLGVTAGRAGPAQEVTVTRILLKVFHAPGRPQSLKLLLRKFRHAMLHRYKAGKLQGQKKKGKRPTLSHAAKRQCKSGFIIGALAGCVTSNAQRSMGEEESRAS